MSRILAVFAILTAMPCVAFAAGDETVVATTRARLPTPEEQAKVQADARAKADIAAKPVSTEDQIVAWLANAPALDRPESDLAPRDDAKAGPRQIHGEAGVSIGTGGYRSAYVSTLIPVGENGTVGLAYSETDFGKNGGYGYGGYGYGGYGYGGYGRRGYGVRSRGGSSKSVALSLGMSDDGSRKSDTPEGCAPGFRDGDRYVEPLWVSRMHAGRDCESGDSSQAAGR